MCPSKSGPAEACSKWGGRALKAREILGGSGDVFSRKILESRVSEIPFSGFCGGILESQDYYKRIL